MRQDGRVKIHFAAVVGVEYDLDLAPWWIPYYINRKLDSYTVFLHREKGLIPESAVKMYADAGFTVKCINGPYNDGLVCAVVMDNFARNLPPEDFLVIADGDEFQAMPDGVPIPYRSCCLMHDVIHGLFEERYSSSLVNCVEDPFVQYQEVEPYTGEYYKTFAPPYLSAHEWPPTMRSKILAARAGEQIRFRGTHALYEMKASADVMFGCRVVHFAWRESAARKFALKSYYEKESIRWAFNGKMPENLGTNIKDMAIELFPEAREYYKSPDEKKEISHALQN
jgi:hypothetical protein